MQDKDDSHREGELRDGESARDGSEGGDQGAIQPEPGAGDAGSEAASAVSSPSVEVSEAEETPDEVAARAESALGPRSRSEPGQPGRKQVEQPSQQPPELSTEPTVQPSPAKPAIRAPRSRRGRAGKSKSAAEPAGESRPSLLRFLRSLIRRLIWIAMLGIAGVAAAPLIDVAVPEPGLRTPPPARPEYPELDALRAKLEAILQEVRVPVVRDPFDRRPSARDQLAAVSEEAVELLTRFVSPSATPDATVTLKVADTALQAAGQLYYQADRDGKPARRVCAIRLGLVAVRLQERFGAEGLWPASSVEQAGPDFEPELDKHVALRHLDHIIDGRIRWIARLRESEYRAPSPTGRRAKLLSTLLATRPESRDFAAVLTLETGRLRAIVEALVREEADRVSSPPSGIRDRLHRLLPNPEGVSVQPGRTIRAIATMRGRLDRNGPERTLHLLREPRSLRPEILLGVENPDPIAGLRPNVRGAQLLEVLEDRRDEAWTRWALVSNVWDLELLRLALETATAESGQRPATLAELVPDVLSRLPTDILTGGSYGWDPEHGRLFATGIDGRLDPPQGEERGHCQNLAALIAERREADAPGVWLPRPYASPGVHEVEFELRVEELLEAARERALDEADRAAE